jgi:hypothetical protein
MKRFLITSVLFFISIQFLYSQDGNNAWTLNGAGIGRIYCGVINPSNQSILYVAGLDSGIYKTTNGGLNWFAVNNGLLSKRIQCLAIAPSDPNVLYAGTDTLGTTGNNGVYKTTNGGGNWVLMIGGLTELSVQSMVVSPANTNTVWACVFNAIGPAAVGLWKTTNGGTNWFASNTGINDTNKNVLSIAINPLNPNVLYVGTSLVLPGSTGPSKIYKTYNGGANWVLRSTGLPDTTAANNPVRALEVLSSDTSIVGAGLFMNSAMLNGGFYLSTNGGQSWVQKHSGLPGVTGSLIRSLKMRSATEFFVGMDGGTTTKGVWRTTNGGNNWVEFTNTVMSNLHPVRMLLFKTTGDTTLYAGAAGTVDSLKGVYAYTWPGAPSAPLPDLIYYKFKNNPSSTSVINYAVPGVGSNPASITGTSVTLAPGGQFDSCLSGTGATGGHINSNWATNFGAGSWTISMWLTIPSSTTLYYLFEESTGGFRCFTGGAAGAGGILLRGTGVTDITVPSVSPGPTVVHFVYDSATATVTAYKNGVFALAVPQATPLNLATGTNFQVGGYSTLASINGLMDEFRVYRRALGQAEITATWNQNLGVLTGITPVLSSIPAEYSLSQNYPNPFNPVTKISFAIPKSGIVIIRVYDVLGREISVLINEFRNAGEYIVSYDASAFSSGTYFYRLESNGYINTKKMTLIK